MISGFKGEYKWLSNMHPCIIQWNGMIFNCTESAYQSSKTLNPEIAKKFQSLNGYESKKYSYKITKRKDWDNIKFSIMSQLTLQKYMNHLDLREKLLNTGNMYIEETNTRNDTYWGVYNEIGENRLGIILMLTRQWLKSLNKYENK